jgi:aminoglycoside phosphotransferase (APT) family kinase protein
MGRVARLEGLVRLGAGREAEVFAWDERRVLRLARDASRSPRVEREARVLAAAQQAGAPVPSVYERLQLDGRAGAIVERLGNESLLDRLGRRPWSLPAVARTLGEVHARVHQARAPAELPALRGELRARLESPLVPGDVRRRALNLLDALPDGDRLCHGDFHPANLLPGRGGDYFVIDWTNGARGHPAADVARTRLMLLGAEPPDDASPLLRRLHVVGRRPLLRGYLRAYRRTLPLAPELVARWEPVCAAARLAEDIATERERLIALALGSR